MKTLTYVSYNSLIALLILMLSGFVCSIISSDLSSSQVEVDGKGRYQGVVISINLKMAEAVEEAIYLNAVKVSL